MYTNTHMQREREREGEGGRSTYACIHVHEILRLSAHELGHAVPPSITGGVGWPQFVDASVYKGSDKRSWYGLLGYCLHDLLTSHRRDSNTFPVKFWKDPTVLHRIFFEGP